MNIKIRQGARLHKLPTGQHLLLDAIWQKFGGLRAAAARINSLDITEAQLNMWRKRGKVPLIQVPAVAKALAVPQAALNYIEISKFTGVVERWPAIVQACGLESAEVAKILKAKKPTL